MKKMILLLAFLTLNLFAGSGIFQSYVIYNIGAGNVYRAGGANADAATGFNGISLGTFGTSSTLIINGGENKTFKNSGSDVTGAKLNYRIYKNGDTPPTFTELNLPYDSDLVNPGDQKWDETAANINALSSVNSSGTWKIEVYWRVTSSDGDHFDNNSGSNFIATFIADETLPVELTSFTAFVKGNSIELAWQTATEVNNHGFEIERRQSGATDWNKIGFKQGQGTSNTKIDYLFVDNSAMAGKYSYRLKQIDRNGKFEYSKTVEATSALSPSSVELSSNFPNPFNPSTSISFTLGATGKASLKVYDVLGKEVAIVTEGIYNVGELNTFNFNADGLTSGVYYYRLMSDAKVETRKMILMK
ncbi:MAG: T9SS type A sorting domain-containing protein [Bacteroidetes bacterium]|nr:T9SS type A sorting domain-containing protein [Bacteroidota bacterium]